MLKKDKFFLKLRGAIAANGYNLKLIAIELGISQQALNEKIQGRKQFTLIEMISVCNILNAQIDIFFEPKLHNLQFLNTKSA